MVSGSISLPSRGPFHLSLTVLFSIGHWVVFRLGGWALLLQTGLHVSGPTLDPHLCRLHFKYETLTLFGEHFHTSSSIHSASFMSPQPQRQAFGLASFPFARRYLGNRCFFLFLRVLRCFSSPGSLAMSCLSHSSVSCHYAGWVSPFRHLWINGYVLLPTAFRSLSRLSSAPSAKASTLCPFSLGLSARVLVRINLVKSLLIFDLAFWLSVEIVDYPSHHIAMLILIFSISSL